MSAKPKITENFLPVPRNHRSPLIAGESLCVTETPASTLLIYFQLFSCSEHIYRKSERAPPSEHVKSEVVSRRALLSACPGMPRVHRLLCSLQVTHSRELDLHCTPPCPVPSQRHLTLIVKLVNMDENI